MIATTTWLSKLLPQSKKREALFALALDTSDQIQSLYKFFREGDHKIDFSQTSFTKVYPSDEKSPAIFWIDDNQLIVRYPKFSTPYNHTFKNKCKFVECLSGGLHDKKLEPETVSRRPH